MSISQFMGIAGGFSHCRLSNGVRYIHVPTDSDVIFLRIALNFGAISVPYGAEAAAHLMEHLFMSETEEISSDLMGDTLDKTMRMRLRIKADVMHFSFAIPRENLVFALEIIASAMARPKYSKQAVELERVRIKNELLRDWSPYNDYTARRLLSTLLWPESPLSNCEYGAGGLELIDIPVLQNLAKQAFCGSNLAVGLAGNIPYNDSVTLLEEKFKAIPRGKRPRPIKASARAASATVSSKIPGCAVSIGLQVAGRRSEEYWSGLLVAEALNEIWTSPLHQRIAEMGVSYGLKHELVSLSDVGLLRFSGLVQKDSVTSIEACIAKYFNEFAEVGLTADHLMKAKMSLQLGMLEKQTNLTKALDRVLIDWLRNGKLVDITARSRRIASVTSRDLKRYAQRWLLAPLSTVIVVGPPIEGLD